MPEINTMKPVGVFEVNESPVKPAVELSFTVGGQPEADAMYVDEADTHSVPGAPTHVVVEQAAEDTKPPEPQDWASGGKHEHFTSYLKDQSKKIPRHSGNTTAGCTRALAFVRKLIREIDKAMETDMDCKIDELEINTVQEQLEEMEARLESRLKELKGKKKVAGDQTRLVSSGECGKCGTSAPLWDDVNNDRRVCLACGQDTESQELVKEAGTPALNVFMTPFERAIVGTLINSTVSAGNNIEKSYATLKEKYNFTPREDLAFRQLVSDYGYPVIFDRGRVNEESNPADGKGIDFATNYHA